MGKKAQESTSAGFELSAARMSGGLINADDVPSEFKDAEGTASGFPPFPLWEEPGNYVIGTFLETKHKVGKNKKDLHFFAEDKDGKEADFSVWGSTVIDNFVTENKVKAGDRLMITYLGTAPTKRGKNEVKKFDIKLVRKTASSKRK